MSPAHVVLIIAAFGFVLGIVYVVVIPAVLLIYEEVMAWIMRRRPTPPDSWSTVESSSLPKATAEQIQHSKEHLAKSCEVRGYHVQRNSHLGLIGHPLKMDEGASLFDPKRK